MDKFILILFMTCFPAYGQWKFDYILDSQTVKGGVKESTIVQGNALLSYEKKIEDLRVFSSVLATHGQTSSVYIGDIQTTSNLDAGGVTTTKLFEAYVEYQVENFMALLGLYELSGEFNVNEPALFFVHSSPGTSAEFASSGTLGAPLYPYSGLGIRLHYSYEDLEIKFAVLDGVPIRADDEYGMQIDLLKGEGVIYVTEVAYTKEERTKVALGRWSYTTNDDHGYYVTADYKFSDYFYPFIRFGKALDDQQDFSSNLVLGFVSKDFGFMASQVSFSDSYEFSNDEWAYELSYQFEKDIFLLQPHLQYIDTPAGDSSIQNAWVLGLRLGISI